MVIYILMLWVLVQLSAPTWCYLLLAGAICVKLLGAFIEFIKTLLEEHDKRKERGSRK